MGSPEGTLALRCGSVYDEQSMLLCWCSCKAECVCREGKQHEYWCDRNEDHTSVCVLRGYTWLERQAEVPEMGVATSLRSGHCRSPAPSQSHSCPSRCKPCWGQGWGAGRDKESHRPHHHQVLSQPEKCPCSPLPSLPSLPLWRWSWALVMGSGLGTTTLGTAVRDWGANCRRGCWAGGGLAIPSTGCIIKKSLRQAGGRAGRAEPERVSSRSERAGTLPWHSPSHRFPEEKSHLLI